MNQQLGADRSQRLHQVVFPNQSVVYPTVMSFPRGGFCCQAVWTSPEVSDKSDGHRCVLGAKRSVLGVDVGHRLGHDLVVGVCWFQ